MRARRASPVFRRCACQLEVYRHQLCETITLRKITYDPEKQIVGWRSYVDGYTNVVAELPAREWKMGFNEYAARLGVWNGKSGAKLHRDLGHLAPSRLHTTMRQMGGRQPLHAAECGCNDCADWNRVFLDETRLDPGDDLGSFLDE